MATFDKKAFSEILNEILANYNSITEMSNEIEMDRGYLSKYLSCKIEGAPSEKILRKIAESSKGLVDLEKLMQICGFNEMIEENNLLVEGNLKYLDLLFEGRKLSNNEKIEKIKDLIDDFSGYIEDCENQVMELEKDELYRIIRKDTINMQKEEIRRSKAKLKGLNLMIKQLQEKNN